MESSLNGRKALVTGGAGGIGAASVRALAARGAKVVIADMDEAAATALADEVGGTSWAVNLLDVEALQSVSLDCDILVNNAGIQRISPIEDFDPADFRRLITLMLEAPFLLIRAALPHMYANN
ncbi:MAG TPA: SDR family NAD(P)-dependent oxidoreductase, partial [Arthrobacter sp.]|nr:SDR family NAD(P)-dependent oxidoreductase [Arthrobacter sp.]